MQHSVDGLQLAETYVKLVLRSVIVIVIVVNTEQRTGDKRCASHKGVAV
jgi:hypothetical protein